MLIASPFPFLQPSILVVSLQMSLPLRQLLLDKKRSEMRELPRAGNTQDNQLH